MRIPLISSALVAALLLAVPSAARAQQTPKSFEKAVTKTLGAKYLLFLPEGYKKDGEKKWPLMLFLHGAGERGDDLAKVKVHGPPKIAEKRQDFPFIVVSPQCPAGIWWQNDVLTALLDEVVEEHAVDEDRIYLTGLSMGGYGTWNLAANAADRLAAIAPICGGGTFGHAYRLGEMPVWVFHGAKDSVVPIDESERMVKFLKRRGNKKVKFTVYPEAGHDSWTESYANEELYRWFLSHRRSDRERKAR